VQSLSRSVEEVICRQIHDCLVALCSVVRFTPFANRLSYDLVPPKAQQLRCRANFEALRFTETITSLAEKAASRMIAKSLNSDGKYISVHLRFEMVRFISAGLNLSY
jgi:hypothetical protein